MCRSTPRSRSAAVGAFRFPRVGRTLHRGLRLGLSHPPGRAADRAISDCPPTGFPTSSFSARVTAPSTIQRTGGHTVDSSSVVVGAEKMVIAGDLVQARRRPYFGEPDTDFSSLDRHYSRLGSARGGRRLSRPRAGDRGSTNSGNPSLVRRGIRGGGGDSRVGAHVGGRLANDGSRQGTGPRRTTCRGGGSIASSGFTTRSLSSNPWERAIELSLGRSPRPGSARHRPRRRNGVVTGHGADHAVEPRLSRARATPCASPGGVLRTSR